MLRDDKPFAEFEKTTAQVDVRCSAADKARWEARHGRGKIAAVARAGVNRMLEAGRVPAIAAEERAGGARLKLWATQTEAYWWRLALGGRLSAAVRAALDA